MTMPKIRMKLRVRAKGTVAGRSLITAAEQALYAARTGDWTGLRIRDVALADCRESEDDIRPMEVVVALAASHSNHAQAFNGH